MCSDVGEFDGSGGGPGEFVISGCLYPHPTPCMKNSHRSFMFHMDPTGQLGAGRWGKGSAPASYTTANVLLVFLIILSQNCLKKVGFHESHAGWQEYA